MANKMTIKWKDIHTRKVSAYQVKSYLNLLRKGWTGQRKEYTIHKKKKQKI